MTGLRKFLFLLVQCTWGVAQAAAGAAVFLRYRRSPHFRFRGAVVTVYPLYSSLSLGPFIFLTDKPPKDRRGQVLYEEIPRRLLVHEYGHTIQSLFLGPFYLPAVGLPSALWANLSSCQRKWRRDVSYFSFFTERSANFLGEKATGEPSMRAVVI